MEQVLVLHCETYYREVDPEGLSHDGSEALHGAIWHEQEFFCFQQRQLSFTKQGVKSSALIFFYSFLFVNPRVDMHHLRGV